MYMYCTQKWDWQFSKRPVHLWPCVDDFDPGRLDQHPQLIWCVLCTCRPRVPGWINRQRRLPLFCRTRNSLHLSPEKMKWGKQHCAALSLCILAPTVLLTYLRFLYRREVIHDVELLANLLKLVAAKVSLIGFHASFEGFHKFSMSCSIFTYLRLGNL